MLYVKIMVDCDRSDTDSFKDYTLVPVSDLKTMRFAQNLQLYQNGMPMPDRVFAFVLEVTSADGGIERYELTGNAYVMTESGKTIASHGTHLLEPSAYTYSKD